MMLKNTITIEVNLINEIKSAIGFKLLKKLVVN
jgi:hypothetical protein